MSKEQNLARMRFGKLVVVELAYKSKNGTAKWKCRWATPKEQANNRRPRSKSGGVSTVTGVLV